MLNVILSHTLQDSFKGVPKHRYILCTRRVFNFAGLVSEKYYRTIKNQEITTLYLGYKGTFLTKLSEVCLVECSLIFSHLYSEYD